MKYFKIWQLAGILILCLVVSGAADNSFTKVGTTGAQFLKLGVGARYTAMGEASVATVNDGYAAYWNPAAMGSLDRSHLEFTNLQWIDGVDLNYFAYLHPTSVGNFGISATALSSGDIEITTIDLPDGTGDTYSAYSYALGVGYARQMTDFFCFGLNVKYVTEQISEERASGVAFDFGTLLETGFKRLRVGMSISNLGPEMKFSGPGLDFNYNPTPENPSYDEAKGTITVDSYDLPLIFRLGAAYDWLYSENTRVTFSVEARDPADNEQQGSIGTEIAFREQFFLRGGWKLNYEEEGLTLGGGVFLPIWQRTDLSLNYAWADFGRLASVHRFSIGFQF